MDLRPETLSELDSRVAVPAYARADLRPAIVHVGVGGFHRAHLATFVDDLCRGGCTDWAIVGAGVLPQDKAMAAALHSQQGLYTLVVRGEGAPDVRVIGSIVDYIHAHPDGDPLADRIAHPDTQIVSLTVTEGGYPVDDETGAFATGSPNAAPGSAFAVIVEGLRRRRDAGVGPLTILSCDNVIGNGHVARTSTVGVARTQGHELAEWIGETIAFPNSMVDRITPATTPADRDWLAREFGLQDAWPVATEPFRQWVVEDSFAAGRLPLEDLEVIITDDVEPYELFKLRLLNASHSCLAYLARVVDHRLVDEVMAEDRFEAFVRAFLDHEAGPVVPAAPGIDLENYKSSLITRFANPAIGDQVDRLCLDGSSKFPKFLVPTIRRQLAVDGPIRLSLLALAGWCVYLGGRSETGNVIDLADDPNLEEAQAFASKASDDPLEFLEFRRVFDEELAINPRVRSTFEQALRSLQRKGVRASIDEALNESSEGGQS